MMSAAAAPLAPVESAPVNQWSQHLPQVRKAIQYIKRRGYVTPDELVAWDAEHGRRLFTWDDAKGAIFNRRQEARLFLNRFRGTFDAMRVRAFIHVHENAEQQITDGGYYTVESISSHQGMRGQVIADIVKRMKVLGSELKMWKLSEKERAGVLQELEAAIMGHARAAA